MELFELIGRIALSGVNEATDSIEALTDSAEKNAQRICSAFEKIGSSALNYGIEISMPDIPKQDNENVFLEGIAGRVRTIVSGGDKTLIPNDSIWQNLSENINIISDKINGLRPIEISEKTEMLTTENYSNTSHEESFFETKNIAQTLSRISRSFSKTNRDESFSEAKNTEEFLSMISRNFTNISRKENYSEKNDFSEVIRRVDETFRSINRNERFSEIISTTKNITEVSADYGRLEKTGRLFEGDFSVPVFLADDISKQIKSVHKSVKNEMPKVTDAQLSELDKLFRKTADRWEKIGSSSTVGIGKMASGITQTMPLVISACDNVAQRSSHALSVDGTALGGYLMGTFESGISQKALEVYNTVSGIARNISSIMSGITFAGISVEAQSEAVSIPEHAKGGIVTREHIAKVGEDGAEAIIPLEHNTEWIDKVASRMSGNVGNSEVVSLLKEIKMMLSNQKIYLDSGQLVGGIAGKMDRKLGSMARLKGRG